MQMNHRWVSGILLSTALLWSACNFMSKTESRTDETITSDIQAKLFADPTLKHHDIRVATDQGVVTVSGAVTTELEKAAVERIAGQAGGVKQVKNQLTVSSESAAAMAPSPTPEPEPAAQPEPTRAAKPAPRPSKPAAAAPQEPEMVPAAAEPAPVSAVQQAAGSTEAATRPAVREPEIITIPAGTTVMVRMIDGIDSEVNRAGEEFAASLDAPVVVDDRVIIRKGADARVRLVNAKTAGKMTGRSELEVELVGLSAGDQTFTVESTGVAKAGASRGKRTAQTVGGGAALGGLIGAIAGKGKGAAIGAAIGAGAGTAVQVMTKGEQVKIPSETQLEFSLKAPITVTM